LLKNSLYDPFGWLGIAHRVKMQHGGTHGYQLFTLMDHPFNAYFAYFLLRFTRQHCLAQLQRNIQMESLRKTHQLLTAGERFQTRDNGNVDAMGTASIHKGLVFAVIKKHLGYDKVRPQIRLKLLIL